MFPLTVIDDREALPKLSNWALGYPRRHFSVSLMLYMLNIV